MVSDPNGVNFKGIISNTGRLSLSTNSDEIKLRCAPVSKNTLSQDLEPPPETTTLAVGRAVGV